MKIQSLTRCLIASLLLLSMSGCVTIPVVDTPSFPEYATSIKDWCGYGAVDGWIALTDSEMEEYAKLLYENNIRVCHIELLSGQGNAYPGCPDPISSIGNNYYFDRPDLAIDRFKVLAKFLKQRKITIYLTMCNWNYTAPKSNMCSIQYNLNWYVSMVNRIKNEIGTEGIVLEPTRELGGARNNECVSKGKQFESWSKSNWGGLLSWNYACRPSSAPSGYSYFSYNTFSSSDVGPKGCICSTDTGKIIIEFSGSLYGKVKDQAKLAKMVKTCKAKGNGFMYFSLASSSDPNVGWNAVDVEAIKTIGKAWGE